MALRITDVVISEKDTGYWPGGIKISTATQIHRNVLMSRVPAELTWFVAIEFSKDDKSTVTVAATVFDPSANAVGSAELSIASDRASGSVELPPLLFRATVTGTYTVRIFVGDICVSSEPVLIEASHRTLFEHLSLHGFKQVAMPVREITAP